MRIPLEKNQAKECYCMESDAEMERGESEGERENGRAHGREGAARPKDD